jgi:hypothetical protein
MVEAAETLTKEGNSNFPTYSKSSQTTLFRKFLQIKLQKIVMDRVESRLK